MTKAILTCLLVDDDADDLFFLERALGKSIFSDIKSFPNTAAVLAYLADAAILPDLIISDLRMPGDSGFDLMNALQKEERTSAIPVIIFSTSASPLDMDRARELQALAYITKPSDLKGYDHVARAIELLMQPIGEGEKATAA